MGAGGGHFCACCTQEPGARLKETRRGTEQEKREKRRREVPLNLCLCVPLLPEAFRVH